MTATNVNAIKCSGPGCLEMFVTKEPISKNAKYTCREHTVQAPNHARFQRYAHDKSLGASAGKKQAHE